MSYIMGLAGLVQGAVQGLKDYKQEAKETEQRNYERDWNQQGRQHEWSLDASAEKRAQGNYDTQQTIYGQQIKENGLKYGAMERADQQDIVDHKRKSNYESIIQHDVLNNVDGMMSVMNDYSSSTPRLKSSEVNHFSKNPDGTISLNTVSSSDPSQILKTLKTGLTQADLKAMAGVIFDPSGSINRDIESKIKDTDAQRLVDKTVEIERRTQPFKMAQLEQRATNAETLAGIRGYIQSNQIDQRSDNRINEMQYSYDNKPQTNSASNGKSTLPVGSILSGANGATVQPDSSGRWPTSAIAQFTGYVESKGRHTTNGRLTPTYDPASSAKGWGQFTDATRNLILKKYGVDAYGSETDAMKATDLLQRYNESLLGGNQKAAAIAHYAGAGEVQKWMAQAQKQGVSWESLIPAKYRERAAQYDQVFGTIQQQASASNSTLTDMVGSQIEPLTDMIVKDMNGIEGITAPTIRGTLSKAAILASKMVTTKDISQRASLYNQAGKEIDQMLAKTPLTQQERTNYRNQVLAQLVGENNISSVGNRGLLGLSSKPSTNNRAVQRQSTQTSSKNPFIDPNADLFKQAPGVDRSLINDALRGG